MKQSMIIKINFQNSPELESGQAWLEHKSVESEDPPWSWNGAGIRVMWRAEE